MRYTLLDTEILIYQYGFKKKKKGKEKGKREKGKGKGKERKGKKRKKERLLQVDPGQNIPEYFSKDIFSKMECLDPRI